MWHEARRQERKIRGMLVDYRKRAERRRDYYEKIKADPTQFLQVHGRQCKIHLDPAIAAAADSTAMMPWQGNESNLIDRFDVRAHLDYIPPVKKDEETDLTQEERQLNYERYRIIAQNAYLGISEEKFLKQLHLEEQFGYTETKTKKEPKGTGAAIGFNYEDGTANIAPAAPPSPEEAFDEDNSDSDLDVDLAINVSKIDSGQAHEMNKQGQHFGMAGNDFYSFLTNDLEEAESFKLAKEEEHEKALYSGRKSRRERRAHREKRLANRKISPPSYAAKESPTSLSLRDESRSPSFSRSPSPDAGKITYITSFGGDDEPSSSTKPTYADKVKYGKAKTRRSSSERVVFFDVLNRSSIRGTFSERGRRSDTKSSRSRSRSRSKKTRDRSISFSPRIKSKGSISSSRRSRSISRGHSRSWHESRGPRSPSPRNESRPRKERLSLSPRSKNRKSLSPRKKSLSRSRSRSRKRQRSRSNSFSSRSRSRSESKSRKGRSRSSSKKRMCFRRRSASSSPLSSDGSPPPAKSKSISPLRIRSKTKSKSPEAPAPPRIRYYGRKRSDESSSESSSSSSSDDDERSYSKSSYPSTSASNNRSGNNSGSAFKKSSTVTVIERLRLKRQALINKQFKKDKIAEVQKIMREKQAQQTREDELREMAIKLRRRQRELRHAYDRSSSSDSGESDKSKKIEKRETSTSPQRNRESSRDREREKRERDRQRSSSRDRNRRENKMRSRSRSREREKSRRSRSGSRTTRRYERNRDDRESKKGRSPEFKESSRKLVDY